MDSSLDLNDFCSSEEETEIVLSSQPEEDITLTLSMSPATVSPSISTFSQGNFTVCGSEFVKPSHRFKMSPAAALSPPNLDFSQSSSDAHTSQSVKPSLTKEVLMSSGSIGAENSKLEASSKFEKVSPNASSPSTHRTPLMCVSNSPTCVALPSSARPPSKLKQGIHYVKGLKRAATAAGSNVTRTFSPGGSQGGPSKSTSFPAEDGPVKENIAEYVAHDEAMTTSETLMFWDVKETEVLVKAKLAFEEDKDAGEVSKFVRKNEAWSIISKTCAANGVLRTWKQCLDRWNRVLKDFKTIFDHGRNTPSGSSAYWAMDQVDRRKNKLSPRFSEQVFNIMEARYGQKRAVELGDILVDTSAHILGEGDKESIGEQKNSSPDADVGLKAETSGQKRRRPGRVAEMLHEVQGSSMKLVDVFAMMEEKRTKLDEDLVEITKEEYEAAKQLNAERLQLEKDRLENERESNRALFQIASAIESFSFVLKD